ncbi:hypothetical protein AA101099_0403 [Neoasaia chiangmaiensis NBRC 101099]|uniref:helicase-related protein n=1 Tax=Neoasaia chiangmaiensis TaxID=320497 RepID=UPI00098BC000|nr:helicase-related protein [Neoasaia chiangmaiensis]GBR36564.1 hypothetical protein AA101099_0403 [Neoasaia chiangmaiensis NBRC 101099]GEN15301.1 hypothetical protein NCH01_17320 [Neoasaia chiangmaiensis]
MENYSSYLNGRDPALPPITLLDYLPKDGLLFVDESHVMIPQISAMYRGDQSRKDTLIDYGFRLPSSKDNHPLNFKQFEEVKPQTIFVSATPGAYELKVSKEHVALQVVRPTGLLDPVIELRPSAGAIDNLCDEIEVRKHRKERVLVTTLTKAAAEDLHALLESKGVRASYLHSDIKTEERTEIIDGLRAGEFDVLIGISLLREGLDIPEASLIAILDADRAGFLRSTDALIQMIGRVARNPNGTAILYADTITPAMRGAISETEARRTLQIQFNEKNGITPSSTNEKGAPSENENREPSVHDEAFCADLTELCTRITRKEKEMLDAVQENREEDAKNIRKSLQNLYKRYIFV